MDSLPANEPAVAEPLPLRPAAGVALFDRRGRVFVGRRIRGLSATWQMPQGGIDPGETPLQAARRELAEETGVTAVELLGEAPGWFEYDLPADTVDRPRWATRYRGQRQKWFAMRYLGEDREIDLATHHPEFSEWRWVRLPETVDLVVPFKRGVYREVVRAFERYAAPTVNPGPGTAGPP